MTLLADPIDFLLDPATGDLDISGGRLHFSTGLQAVAQGVRIRVRMIRGEWFLDQSLGVPYLRGSQVAKAEALLGEKFDAQKASAAFRDVIAAAPNVTQVLLSNVVYDGRTRKMSLSWAVSCAFGDTSVETLNTVVG